ncbi:hypothetical protein BJ508DRAFT_349339 [Ascobolus immersus RN42]|uniref:BTB domain-containing protein n=1 Tax=Ascobolus immersus RN42 TaxID=1160509 RepID=A0A3N4HXA7_ASCIM|nr:hypothetical protein BJ508DRAFT_349339 [Ascobolus immersus RN42]
MPSCDGFSPSELEYFNSHGCKTTVGTCPCHGALVRCDGTENKSYCMIGCNKCYPLLKKRKARFEELEEAEKEKDRLAKRVRELEEAEKEKDRLAKRVQVLEQQLNKTFEELNEAQRQLDEVSKRRPVDWQSLDGDSHYSRIFQSPVVSITIRHPSAGPKGITYRLHVDRLCEVSSFYAQRIRAYRTTVYNETSLCHPVAFKYFVQFLYCGDYILHDSLTSVACYIHTLVYFVADQLGAPALKEAAELKLVKCLETDTEDANLGNQAVVKMVEAVYESTSESFGKTASGYHGETEVLNTPASSIDGVDEDESDTDMTVQDEEGAGENNMQLVKSKGELENTLICLGIDETNVVSETCESLAIHPMRERVSRYVVYRMEDLNKRADFRALLRRFPEFTVDMMIAKENM